METNIFDVVDGTIVRVAELPELVICEKCGFEIEEEAIVRDEKPYHYNCSGIEL